jgi:hypothetical protein
LLLKSNSKEKLSLQSPFMKNERNILLDLVFFLSLVNINREPSPQPMSHSNLIFEAQLLILIHVLA